MSTDGEPGRGSARQLARDVLVRIDRDGAYANLALPAALGRSSLDTRDRGFATELVYGVTRMRRALDWLVDRFLRHDPDPVTRAVLRLGAYQLVWLDTPPHAAVSATVSVAPARTRSLVNAVLRKVSQAGHDWPDEATRLSYPDWLLERLAADLGPDEATAALAAMNQPARVVQRDDGYRQDTASQWVTEAVSAEPGQLVVDLCAGPGGKATGLAASGAAVLGLELHPARAGLVAANARRLGSPHLLAVAGDGRRPPVRAGRADRVLVDAPCSGLGALRRRPDARWRVADTDIDHLVELQRTLLEAAMGLARPEGEILYSVCTLTAAETLGIDGWLARTHPEWAVVAPAGGALAEAGRAQGRGVLVLPQAAGTDGMFLLRLRR